MNKLKTKYLKLVQSKFESIVLSNVLFSYQLLTTDLHYEKNKINNMEL